MKKLIGLVLLGITCISNAQIVVEAESGQLQGTEVSNWTSGYSGTGYVNGLDNDGDKVTVSFNVPNTASYKLEVTYNAGSYKEQKLIVNGVDQGKVQMPQTNGFEKISLGGVFLEAGMASIGIEKDWGWVDIDNFILTEVPAYDYTVTSELINPNADNGTKALYEYLRGHYGKKVISGQISYEDELIAIAGKEPVIRAIDFQPYTQGYNYNWENGGHAIGWRDAGRSEELIAWHQTTNGCGIVTIQWHWSSPSGSMPGVNSFYTNQTNFSVTRAVNPSNPEYDLIIEDIDSVATQLKKFQAAGIPVLWRPLHEAGGAWFWWGAEGHEPALELWDIVYDRLTNYHELNNLIWVWSTPEADWYPGNDKVDIFGFDSYPGDFNYATQKAMFDQLNDICNREKIVALTENGPIPDIDALQDQDAMWAYFASWDNLVAEQNSNQHIQASYANDLVLTMDDPCGILTSVEDEEQGGSIYPNPTLDMIYLPEMSSYKVVSLTGELLLEGVSNQVNVADLPSGVYVVEQQGSVYKVVKQ